MARRPTLTSRRRRAGLVAAALALCVTVVGLSVGTSADHPDSASPRPTGAQTTATVGATEPGGGPTATGGGQTGAPGDSGVLPAGFILKAGTATQPAVAGTTVVTGKALPHTVVAQILARLPRWSTTSNLGADFAWPAPSLTKPTAGTTINQTFPADTDSQNLPTKPAQPRPDRLKVLRMQPQGSVSLAPFVSITFNQPMVAVSTIGQLTHRGVPATITPAIRGHWDWIGTTTLRFTADSTTVDRLPMATRFTVKVPAGTRSQSGGVLASAVTATFDTPPPVVQTFTPEETAAASRHPVMVALFNQRVDPATVLQSVVATADSATWPVRLATENEIAADSTAAATLSTAPEGRAVAFVPTRDFPTAATIEITIKAGARSVEGPLTSASDADFHFSTYGPMDLASGSCVDSGCEPGGPIELTFSNPIDPDTFDPASVSVDPHIPGGASIGPAGTVITISGATQPATDYHVTIEAGLKDTFNQRLARDATVTVRFGHADTRIYPFPTMVTTLDPTATKPAVTVTTVNEKRLRERVYAVDLGDWAAFRAWSTKLLQLGNYTPGDDLHVPSWPVLVDRTVTVPGAADQTISTAMDLSDQLTGGRKQAVVLIEPIDPGQPDQPWLTQPTATWAQSTSLAIDAIADRSSLRAWVTDLRTSRPVSGVTVTMLAGNGAVMQPAILTDASGLAARDLTTTGGSVLVATLDGQRALLPSDMWGDGWRTEPLPGRRMWYVTDDRQTYRPGETVSVKGWVRDLTNDTTATLTTPGSGSVAWSATDGYGTPIGHGTAALDRLGGFDLTLAIPAGAHLGAADLQMRLADTADAFDFGNDHRFTIADYRTPAFQVQTHTGTDAPAIRGTDLTVQTDATYYAGGPVGDAPVAWQVSTATASYAPPGWDSYTFGVWTPWWYDTGGGYASSPGWCCGESPTTDNSDGTARTFHGTTDSAGSDYLAVNVGDVGKDSRGLPVAVVAQAAVTDVDRQQIAGTANILVHPAAYYVGLRSDATFIRQGEKLTLQAVATTIDGAVKAGRPITVTAARVVGGRWDNVDPSGHPAQTVTDPHTCTVTSASTPVACTFTPTIGGEYQITATISDEQGRTSRTQLTRRVAGPDGSVDTTVQEQALTLVPDRQEYQPGQSATLLVASPITTGTGLVTVSHNGIVQTSTFTVTAGSAVVKIPITQALIPGVSVAIEVVGTVPRSADPAGGKGTRPAYATGQIDLAVSAMSRSLTVTAKPRQSTVKPGGATTIDVTVTDHAGKPVPDSEFEVIVVDEAVLALSGYQLPDPIAAFYADGQNNWNGVSSVYGRSTVMLGQQIPDGGAVHESAASSAAASSAAPAGSGGKDTASMALPATPPTRSAGAGSSATGESSNTPIEQRSAFSALALFRPTVTTGADGTAAIPVTLPDNLTRYRVMVVAVAGDAEFGSGESTITAGLPLTVRPSPPRFLNFGDTAQLPVVVQNLTDAPLTTDVVLQAANLTVAGSGSESTASAAGKQVTVPANGRVEVRFGVAADRAGTARFRVAAVSGDAADAAQQEFPVYTPSTSETFATYGTVAGNTVVGQKLTKPTGVIPAFGGLTVSTSSTALAQLTDAVDFVANDDYASSDALATRIIAISSLGDVLQAFSTPGLPSPKSLKALVTSEIATLVALQNSDGGFPYWERGEESDPFNTIQVVQALLIAQKYGYTGAKTAAVTRAVTKALPYLTDIDGKLPVGTSQQTRDTINAYALAVRSLAGDTSAAPAADAMVTNRAAALPLDAVAWLAPVVSPGPRQTLLDRVNNAAVDDAGSVTFTQAVTDDSWTVLQSDPRTDALILDALLTVDPTSDLIGKAVNGLMAQQRGGRWDTMQDNAFALVAWRHYYDSFESTTPDFLAAVWLGDRLAGDHTYTGHTTEQTSVTIPVSEVIKSGDTSITLADNGSGRMYYRIALTTAPSSLTLGPLDRGFAVARSYQGADHASDVTRDGNGVWHIKAGARVRVTVTMVSRSAQSHVALTDPLPAGLEPLNPELATTPKDLAGKNASGGDADPFSWMPTWYDHQDLRDDRAEAFASWLQGGVYTYSYLALATTPGTFIAPPSTAQQVYAPETFGRSSTDRVVVRS